MVEKTDERRYVPYVKDGGPCSCGNPECPRLGYREDVWVRKDTGEKFVHNDLPVGAMWWAPWFANHYFGFDGKSLVVKTPGGEWLIDSQASNCTRKGDNTHRCWLRDGEAPNITVGKNGPNTCSAGAGSILIGNYHGFLRNGYLESC